MNIFTIYCSFDRDFHFFCSQICSTCLKVRSPNRSTKINSKGLLAPYIKGPPLQRFLKVSGHYPIAPQRQKQTYPDAFRCLNSLIPNLQLPHIEYKDVAWRNASVKGELEKGRFTELLSSFDLNALMTLNF